MKETARAEKAERELARWEGGRAWEVLRQAHERAAELERERDEAVENAAGVQHERDDKQDEYDWLIDEINRRLGLPEDEFHSPSPALDGIDKVQRERDEARRVAADVGAEATVRIRELERERDEALAKCKGLERELDAWVSTQRRAALGEE